VQLAPDERGILENRIAIARASEDWPTVAGDASRLIEQFPTDVVLRLERGKALANQGNFTAARDDFDRAVVLSPSADAYYLRGCANHDLGQHDAAIYDFSKAIELDPAYADAYRRRAHAEYRRQRYLGAARDCGEYIRLRPDDGEGYYCRGIMLSRAGDQDAAIADYRRAIELTDSPATAGNAWYGIGLSHERAQRIDEAIAAYRKTVESYPEQAQARPALERLTKPN
jgi:tetratricopeptide (TPR) repeat protein